MFEYLNPKRRPNAKFQMPKGGLILIRCAKCQIFGIWHTKHQKQTLMRCAKCLKILRHATVRSQIWERTDRYAIISLIILFTFLSPSATQLSLSLSPHWSPYLHCSLFLSHFHFFYLSVSSSLSAFRYYRRRSDPFISMRPRSGENFDLLSLIRRKWLLRMWRWAKPGAADLSSLHTSSISLSLSLFWWLWQCF